MTIYSPAASDTFGALDSSAFEDGAPYSAHTLRSLARGANRLASKGQHLICLAWPIVNTYNAETDAHIWGMMSAVVYPWWTQILPEMIVPKRPGMTNAGMRLLTKVANTFDVAFLLKSQACPGLDYLPTTHSNVVTYSGTGTYDNVSLDNALLVSGDYEIISLWAKADAQNIDNEATYGAPRASTFTYPTGSLSADTLIVQAATWTSSMSYPGNEDYASGGHVIVFLDDNDNVITAPRRVTWVETVRLSFDPPLEPFELQRAQRGGSFQILQCPRVAIGSFSVACVDRSP